MDSGNAYNEAAGCDLAIPPPTATSRRADASPLWSSIYISPTARCNEWKTVWMMTYKGFESR